MLERMKKMIKKEKGFTLVELLAVIAILGIILAIAIPSVSGIIQSAEDDAHDSNVKLIENAGKLAYIAEEDASDTYTLSKLVDLGYLEDIPEAVGNHSYSPESTVDVSDNGATYDGAGSDEEDGDDE